jgi:hypothetical protein
MDVGTVGATGAKEVIDLFSRGRLRVLELRSRARQLVACLGG